MQLPALSQIFILLLLSQYLKGNETTNQYELFLNLKHWSCFPNTVQPAIPGAAIFSNSISPTVNDFTITGWYTFRGEKAMDYNIITVQESGLNIYKIYYHLIDNKIRIKLLSDPTIEFSVSPSLTKVNWYFIMIRIEYTNLIYFTFVLMNELSNSFIINYQTNYSVDHQSSFQKNNLQIIITSSVTTIPESCTITKNLYFYWDSSISISDLLETKHDLVALDTYLLWNYDLFYSKQNNGYIINTAIPNQKQQISLDSPQELGNGGLFFTDYVNASEQGGFIVSFHVKLNNNPPSGKAYYILSLIFIQDPIQIFILDGTINLNNQQNEGATLTQWNQLTLIVKLQMRNKAILIVNEDYANQLIVQDFSSFSLTQLEFGSSQNNGRIIYLSNIQVFLGTFISDDANYCQFLTARNQKNCLICVEPSIKDYQSNQRCVNISAQNQSTLIRNVKDWYPIQIECPIDMILDSSNKCTCRFQFYKDGDQCLQCKDYCQGCTDANTCIQQDPNRNSEGVCYAGHFDDGYSCLIQDFTILSKTNISWVLAQQDLTPSCIITIPCPSSPVQFLLDNNSLDLKAGSQFLFSFSFKAYSASSISPGSAMAYLEDSGNELFSIFYQEELPYYKMVLYSLGSPISEIVISQEEPAWVGIWTDLSKVVFFAYSNFEMQIDEKSISLSSFTFSNPILCVGKCKSQYSSVWTCANFSYTSITFIHNILYPNSKYRLINLIAERTTDRQRYIVDLFSTLSIDEMSNDITLSQNKLIFNQSAIVDRLKGIKFVKSLYGTIFNINLQLFFPTFHCSIFIEKINYQVQIVDYKVGSIAVQYCVVPYGTKAFLRICLLEYCQDTKYSMLILNKQNSLFILTLNKSPFSSNYLIVQFEVICNYQREYIQFYQELHNLSGVSTDIQLGYNENQVGDYVIYLNYIEFIRGHTSYYIDYTTDKQNCFLMKNVYNMKCLFPKRNYVFYLGELITEDQCIQLAESSGYLFVVNQSTKQCVNTYLPSLCSEVDILSQTIQCKTCKYLYADLNNGCQCPDGTYFDTLNLICQPCSEQCLTCEDSKSKCIECKQSIQDPPSCDCNISNYYKDENYLCQKCSYKCGTCEQDPNFCTTCAINRDSKNDCECELGYQEVNEVCVKIECNENCNGCQSQEDNCIKCKQGRIDPPNCECDVNYYPTDSGECLQCPSSTYYNSIQNSCQSCQKPCKQCEYQSDNCVSCDDGYYIDNFQCKCSNGTSAILLNSGNISCLEDMDAAFKIILNLNYYNIQFTFDYDIQSIDFTKYSEITSLISLSFSEISSEYYYLNNPTISGNTFTLKLNVKKSFKTLSGNIIFNINSPFISVSERYILGISYTITPISFQIGPFIFDETILSSGLDETISKLKHNDSSILHYVQQSQVLLYFINTAQPTLQFLLLKAQLPPNLYKFYQVFGLLILPDVVDYQTTNYKEHFTLFNTDLNQTEVYLCGAHIYQKLGFSNSLLINNTVLILKYFLILLLILVLIMIKQYFFGIRNKVKSPIQILLQKINSENEANLLIIIVSISLQFTENNESSWANRYGYYISILLILILLLSFLRNLYEINSQTSYTNNETEFSNIFTNRLLNNLTIMERNFFLIQLLKKYIVTILLFSLQDHPYFCCIINGIIFFASAIQTLISKPYKTNLNRIIKIIGELILSFSWFLHLMIIQKESKMNNEIIIDEVMIQEYIRLGNIAIIALLIFNIIYIIQVLEQTYNLIFQYFQKNQKSTPNLNPKIYAPHENYKYLKTQNISVNSFNYSKYSKK